MSFSKKLKRSLLKLYAQRAKLRVVLAVGLGFIIFIQILAFSPIRLEAEAPPPEMKESDLMPVSKDSQVTPTLPRDRVPEYSVDGFQYISVTNGIKQWKIKADHAFFYQKEGIAHTQVVQAIVYDKDGKETHIAGNEAKYFFSTGDLEVFGDVLTTFADGLKTKSQYMKYTGLTRNVEIPVSYLVEGWSDPTTNKDTLEFEALGMNYQNITQKAELLSQVKVLAKRDVGKPGGPEQTTIQSDRAIVDRNRSLVRFFMADQPGQKIKLIAIDQPGMKCEARRAEFQYGAKEKQLRTVRAFEEVKIEEIPQMESDYKNNPRAKAPLKRYATSGLAEFDTIKNLIVLREFPQVYQDRDTITGEVIILHRLSNLVEVEQSNAISTPVNDDNDET